MTDHSETGLDIVLDSEALEHVVNPVAFLTNEEQVSLVIVEVASGNTLKACHRGALEVEVRTKSKLWTTAYCIPSLRLNLLCTHLFDHLAQPLL